MSDLDVDAVVAVADLVGRSGATNFEIGWLNDEDDPVYTERGPEWWCKAQYRGARLHVEGFARPDDAAIALARKLLTGAKCRCGRLVRIGDDTEAFAHFDVAMADGTRWTAQEAAEAGQCNWRREGQKWNPSCPEPNRARRRRNK